MVKKNDKLSSILINSRNYEIFLLSEWHQLHNHQGTALEVRFPIRVFGSFLNAESWNLSRVFLDIFNSQDIPELSELFELSNIRIAFIFFPISTNSSINLQFKYRLQKFLELTVSQKSEFFLSQIDQNIALASRIVSIKYREIEWKKYELSNSIKKYQNIFNHNRRFIHWENRLLFGALAARYLDIIKIFPQLWIGSRYYSGIPLQVGIREFVLKYVLSALFEEEQVRKDLSLYLDHS
ncbi:hypothetical protein [Candidatus Harpocratesius sp.]